MTRILLAAALVLVATTAHAQAQSAPDPKACAPGERLQPGDGTTGQGAIQGESMSEKLARTDGVLCPPEGMDSEMQRPTPDAGRTPVIPPPGSPGGDPSIQPK